MKKGVHGGVMKESQAFSAFSDIARSHLQASLAYSQRRSPLQASPGIVVQVVHASCLGSRGFEVVHRGNSTCAPRFFGKSLESCPRSWVRAPPGDNISIFNIFPKNLGALVEWPQCIDTLRGESTHVYHPVMSCPRRNTAVNHKVLHL